MKSKPEKNTQKNQYLTVIGRAANSFGAMSTRENPTRRCAEFLGDLDAVKLQQRITFELSMPRVAFRVSTTNCASCTIRR
jgi:hypothetical protein